MNINDVKETRAPVEGEPFGDDEQVEVLVEDLFIEQYPAGGMMTQPMKSRGAPLGARPRRRLGKRIVMGVLAIGMLAVVTAIFGASGRKTSRLARMLRKRRFAI